MTEPRLSGMSRLTTIEVRSEPFSSPQPAVDEPYLDLSTTGLHRHFQLTTTHRGRVLFLNVISAT